MARSSAAASSTSSAAGIQAQQQLSLEQTPAQAQAHEQPRRVVLEGSASQQRMQLELHHQLLAQRRQLTMVRDEQARRLAQTPRLARATPILVVFVLRRRSTVVSSSVPRLRAGPGAFNIDVAELVTPAPMSP